MKHIKIIDILLDLRVFISLMSLIIFKLYFQANFIGKNEFKIVLNNNLRILLKTRPHFKYCFICSSLRMSLCFK